MQMEDDVATISHDLKNPLSVIALDVCVLQERLPTSTSADLRRALRRIEQNVAFMDRLVHDLLDLSVIDASGLVLMMEPIELAELVTDVVERITTVRDRSRVLTAVPASVLVMADSSRIERVLANLLLNALKYAPPDTNVLVRLEACEDRVSVAVIDDGPGLAPEDAAVVFEKFKRTTSSTGHEGCGLGLFVSRKIIEAHRGRIGVESVHGKGSRFYFELPLLGAAPL